MQLTIRQILTSLRGAALSTRRTPKRLALLAVTMLGVLSVEGTAERTDALEDAERKVVYRHYI